MFRCINTKPLVSHCGNSLGWRPNEYQTSIIALFGERSILTELCIQLIIRQHIHSVTAYKSIAGVNTITALLPRSFDDCLTVEVCRGAPQINRKWRAQGMLRCCIWVRVQRGCSDAILLSGPFDSPILLSKTCSKNVDGRMNADRAISPRLAMSTELKCLIVV